MLRTNTMPVSAAIRSHRWNDVRLMNSGKICRDDDHHHHEQHSRKKVVQRLEARLRNAASANKDNEEGAHDDANLAKMALRLEQLLFESSTSLASHCDVSTLDDRLRLLFTVQTIQRRLLFKKGSNPKSSSKFTSSSSSSSSLQTLTRAQKLRKILGKERYYHAQELVREIKNAKNNKVATMKCCSTTGVCSRPFRDTFPKVVSDLFFHTPLIDAFERMPLDSTTTTSHHHGKASYWDELIDTAEKNLQAYNKWSGNTTN